MSFGEIFKKLALTWFWMLYGIVLVSAITFTSFDIPKAIVMYCITAIGVLLGVRSYHVQQEKDSAKLDEAWMSTLESIANRASAEVGQEYFDSTCEGILKSTGYDYAMVAELKYTEKTKQPYIKTRALYNVGGKLPNAELLINTKEMDCGATKKSMADYLKIEIENCIERPLYSTKKTILGYVACVRIKESTRAAQEDGYVKSVLKIFSARCQAELERIQTEEQLTYQAHHDSLTGLKNRNFVVQNICDVINSCEGKEFSHQHIYFIDLDDFKEVNDEFGHEYGDKLLNILSKRLKSCIRSDDVVARLGGDEFVIVEQSPTDSPGRIAGRLVSVLQQMVPLDDDVEVSVTASLGYLEIQASMTPTDVLKYADFAMYKAKEQGKNKAVMFTTQLFEDSRREKHLEQVLIEAVQQKAINIVVQPIMKPDGGILKGEVLARFPTANGQMNTEQFIRLAEKRGLIYRIGKIVTEKAFAYCAELKHKHRKYARLAINCSVIQLKNSTYVSFLTELAQKHNVSPKQITIEITETVMDEENIVLPAIEALREAGFGVAIDDFGTGYSSISFLEKMPADTIKVDRSMVTGSSSSSKKQAILKAVAEICQAHEYELVAEGVETKHEVDLLTELGYTGLQGYYFSKPVPTDEYTQIILRGN